ARPPARRAASAAPARAREASECVAASTGRYSRMLQKPRLRRDECSRARVGRQPFTHMVAKVLQHVAHGVDDLAQRRQHVRVIAIDEYLSGAVREAIECAREPYREPLHRPRQRLGAFGLDDEVKVVALDGIVDDANAESLLGLAQGLFDRALA